MTDEASLADQKSLASQVQALHLRGPSALIHVGRPDVEEPHKSMKRVVKLRQDHPATRLFILVWDKEDVEAMKPYEDEKVKVLHWETDEKLSDFLMDFLMEVAGAAIIGPRYYICPDKHITEGSYAGLVEKCDTCGHAVVYVNQNEERVKQFAEIFMKVIQLANFDTRSGEWLQTQVSPTGNILANMRYISGCDHAEPESAKGECDGKTMLVVGAGPSLENAIPHLKRLSHDPEYRVICVGRVFKMLHAAGVDVDYTASCEMFDWDAAIFQDVTRDQALHTTLAFASMCAPATVKAWPGRKVPMLDLETSKLLKRDDWIYGGNSVAHHMLNFAFQILGAKDAILVGIDLAYTKMRTHAEGANHEGWPQVVKEQEDQFQDEKWVPCTGKGDEFDPECHRVPVAMGGGVAISKQILVRSSPSYECFATLFSVLISKHKRKVWNASPNGQRIQGTEYIDLAKVGIQ